MNHQNRLAVRDREGWAKEYVLDKAIVHIGSDPRNDIILEGGRGHGVAPLHAQLISMASNGHGYRLVNLSDTNMTLGATGDQVLAPRSSVNIVNGQSFGLGDFTLIFYATEGDRTAGAATGSQNIGLKITTPHTRLAPHQTLDGLVIVGNLGERSGVQFYLELEGLDEECFSLEPGPLLSSGAEKEVFFQIRHRGHKPLAGDCQITIRATAPKGYPAEEAVISHTIQVLPFFKHKLYLLSPDGVLTPEPEAEPTAEVEAGRPPAKTWETLSVAVEERQVVRLKAETPRPSYAPAEAKSRLVPPESKEVVEAPTEEEAASPVEADTWWTPKARAEASGEAGGWWAPKTAAMVQVEESRVLKMQATTAPPVGMAPAPPEIAEEVASREDPATADTVAAEAAPGPAPVVEQRPVQAEAPEPEREAEAGQVEQGSDIEPPEPEAAVSQAEQADEIKPPEPEAAVRQAEQVEEAETPELQREAEVSQSAQPEREPEPPPPAEDWWSTPEPEAEEKPGTATGLWEEPPAEEQVAQPEQKPEEAVKPEAGAERPEPARIEGRERRGTAEWWLPETEADTTPGTAGAIPKEEKPAGDTQKVLRLKAATSEELAEAAPVEKRERRETQDWWTPGAEASETPGTAAATSEAETGQESSPGKQRVLKLKVKNASPPEEEQAPNSEDTSSSSSTEDWWAS